MHHKAALQAVIGTRLDWIDDGLRGWCGQFVFDVLQQFEKLPHGGQPVFDRGTGAELDEILQLLAGAIHDFGNAQAVAGTAFLVQFFDAGGWGVAGEHMIGDRAQGENVEFRGVKRHPGNGFWRHVEQTLWIAKEPQVPAVLSWGTSGIVRRPFALCRLPVEYFHGDGRGLGRIRDGN